MPVQPLPIILSLPHGGLQVPPEVAARLAIHEQDLYNDCDLWVDQLYDFEHEELAPLTSSAYGLGAYAVTRMPIARALVDVNRPLSALGHPDGPVKSQTSYGKAIYQSPLDDALQQALLTRYWQPYHAQLTQALYDHAGRARLLIDCHNMAQHGPSAYADAGQTRPLICIVNMGDAQGEIKPEHGWTTCPPAFARAAAGIAAELFADLPLLEPAAGKPAPVALLNSPFGRSYILDHNLNANAAAAFRQKCGCPAPLGIMIEVNRGLLVGDQNADAQMAPPNQERISAIRQRLYQWIVRILELLD